MKKLLIITVALMLVAPALLFAGDKNAKGWDEWETYVRTTDPGNTPVIGGVGWDGPYVYGEGPTDTVVGAGDTIWIGIPNEENQNKKKYLSLTITGDNVGGLVTTDFTATGYMVDSSNTQAAGSSSPITSNSVVFSCWFIPQPEWEVVRIINNSGVEVTIETLTARTTCSFRVPSLTTYGLAILALLLIGSAWIVRRRKALTIS